MSSARQRPLAILRPLAAVGLGLTLVLLAGCGAGQVTQTALQASAVDGAQGDIGPIAVRNATLAYPAGNEHFYRAGEDAPLVAFLVNTGTTEDELTSVRSPAAEIGQVEGQTRLPAQRTVRAVAQSKEADEAAPPASTGGLKPVSITLVNLREDVRPGKTVRVTFLFRQAGELTLDVPVGAPAQESPTTS